MRMAKKSDGVSSVVLLGLADNLAPELRRALSGRQLAVCSVPFPNPLSPSDLSGASDLSHLLDGVDAEVVFCGAKPEQYTSVLGAIKQHKPGVPLVVVSRLPDVCEWLEALKAGACDYCAPPFESTQMGWILESALRARCGSS